jgi:hypothetical protein
MTTGQRNHEPHIREEAVPNSHVLSFSTAASAVPPAATVGVAELDSGDGVDGIVGHSPLLSAVLHRVRRVAPTDMPVLITGETGTGKELVARAIHRRSRRAARHLISVNLAAVPETLAAAALFGHEKGAFTGADRLRVGRFEAADRGTLCLDEIGELRADLQVMPEPRSIRCRTSARESWRATNRRAGSRTCSHTTLSILPGTCLMHTSDMPPSRRCITDFTAVVYDLRAPLNVMLGHIQFLVRRTPRHSDTGIDAILLGTGCNGASAIERVCRYAASNEKFVLVASDAA